jgi:hypothetical protein
MRWPLSQEYNEAIQNPSINLADPDLCRCRARTNALGLPVPCSGNFADVYQLSDGTRAWAVKCFTREVPGRRERYTEIIAHLTRQHLPVTVAFEYLDHGIRVHGEWYPVLKMDWVDGIPLNAFVKQNLENREVLEGLADAWRVLARLLQEANVAHGDLQHGNILLVPGRKPGRIAVRLVDYDGMFVPSLADRPSGEVGHPAYQHQERLRECVYSPEADRFPLLLIYCAIRGLIIGGQALWERHDYGDNLLFRETDLRDPKGSSLFWELARLNDPEVRRLVDCLSRAAYEPLDETPTLDDLIAGFGTTLAHSPQDPLGRLNDQVSPDRWAASAPPVRATGRVSFTRAIDQITPLAPLAADSVRTGVNAEDLDSSATWRLSLHRNAAVIIALAGIVGLNVVYPVLHVVWAYQLLALAVGFAVPLLASHTHRVRNPKSVFIRGAACALLFNFVILLLTRFIAVPGRPPDRVAASAPQNKNADEASPGTFLTSQRDEKDQLRPNHVRKKEELEETKLPHWKGLSTERKKWQDRWLLVFQTQDGKDYVRQLMGLGAMLGVPEPDGRHIMIHDLALCEQARREDTRAIDLISWIDDDPASVRSLARALELEPVPTRFIVYFSVDLEKRLRQEEITHVSGNEDDIVHTYFNVVCRSDGQYEPVFRNVVTREKKGELKNGPTHQMERHISSREKATVTIDRSRAIGGNGGEAFEDQGEPGNLLIGFAFKTRDQQIAFLQPLYRTPSGRTLASSGVGNPRNAVAHPNMLAKDGYAIGGLLVWNDPSRRFDLVRGIRVLFMRQKGAALDPGDCYWSDWIGLKGEGTTLGGDGNPVVGIHGRAGVAIDSLGILQRR